jgi:rod shape determining protein RodA
MAIKPFLSLEKYWMLILITPNKLKRQLISSIKLDHWVIGCMLGLFALGLLTLASANDHSDLLLKQCYRLVIGLCLMLLISYLHPKHLFKIAPWAYLAVIVLLILVHFFGDIGKGARRWLDLGVLRFQPSECLKVIMPLTMAWVISFGGKRHQTLLISLLILVIPVFLVLKQPDLGTALLIAASGLGVIFLAGFSLRIWLYGLLAGLLSLPIIWHHLHHYQKMRIFMLINPESDPLGSGYHIIQSKIAIGSGGLLGKGWNLSTQAHLQFLPEPSTDFIFALFAEEWGLIGCLLLLALWLALTLRCLKIAQDCQSWFGQLLAGGITLMLLAECFVNIGMVTGILPVVGVPLPFMSYGGTSLITSLTSIGLILSIKRYRRQWRAA